MLSVCSWAANRRTSCEHGGPPRATGEARNADRGPESRAAWTVPSHAEHRTSAYASQLCQKVSESSMTRETDGTFQPGCTAARRSRGLLYMLCNVAFGNIIRLERSIKKIIRNNWTILFAPPFVCKALIVCIYGSLAMCDSWFLYLFYFFFLIRTHVSLISWNWGSKRIIDLPV